MDLRSAGAVASKEVRHILRDPFTIAFALGVPVLLVSFFGFVIDFNYRDVALVLEDRDKSLFSRRLAEAFSSSGYFLLKPPTASAAVAADLERDRASGVLVIEPGFGKKAASGLAAEVQVLVDGADNSKAGVLLGYLETVAAIASRNLYGRGPPPSPDVRTRFLFNPELNSRWFVVPGLTAVIIGLLSVLLTALTVAREWENGSMELLLSTPVRPIEIVLGKMAPYVALALGAMAAVWILARIVFGLPFAGSRLLYVASCLVFIVTSLSQGLLISVLTRQQQIAMQFSIMSSLLPSMLLSGFIFPIESMPAFFHYFTAILPVRWFMVVSRGIFLKGAGPVELAGPLAAMLLLAAAMVALANGNFKKDLEP